LSGQPGVRPYKHASCHSPKPLSMKRVIAPSALQDARPACSPQVVGFPARVDCPAAGEGEAGTPRAGAATLTSTCPPSLLSGHAREPRRIGEPRKFINFGQGAEAWTVEEREPEKVDLPAAMSVLYFWSGSQRRWTPYYRGSLRLLSQRELCDLLRGAKPIPAPGT
jgi:hypothetical protein